MKKLNKKLDKKQKHILIITFLLTLIILGLVDTFILDNEPKEISYNEFVKMAETGEIEKAKVPFKGDKFTFVDKEDTKYITDNPDTENFKEFLLKQDIEVKVTNSKAKIAGLINMLSTFFMFGLMFFIFKSIGSNLFEKKNLLVANVPDTKFKNIAGNEEAKEDMEFLVNFLKDPKKYNEIGAKLPKGVVLYGPPGTGKTLTAKAIAGEAGVPFFSTSGSDFIEMYAGLGAKRVRDLFKDAKEKAPCIIFIDEIDAVGTNRGGHNNSEKDQTINALLAELDGFNTKEPIVTIIATNRIDSLDSALIRPGRFDKHIAINLPDSKDRLSILQVHTENKKLDEDVDLNVLSKLTIGMSGAALEALVNEAAILAVNQDYNKINNEHMNEAYFKMLIGGHKKKNRDRNEKEVELIAYHEAGHALAAKLLTDNDIPKVSIIPSTTGMGGVTFNIPKSMSLLTKNELLNNIKVLYAGRAAEIILRKNEGEITTGASQDIKQATEHIEDYFANYGMSEFGMLSIIDKKYYHKEAVELSKKLYEDVLILLKSNQYTLKNIATELIEKETLNEEDLDRIINKQSNNI